jgi:BirA family biotin operon repressor/biotin-[acetyl-CoA-carboxylase] ligase
MDTSDRLAEILLSASVPVSGEEVARTLGLTRTAVWKAVRRLRESGYVVKAVPRKGYRLETVPDRLFPVLLRSKLKCELLASEIHYFETIDSTNREAKKSAAGGASEGLLVVAEEQTHGRGRLDRKWTSPKGGESALLSRLPSSDSTSKRVPPEHGGFRFHRGSAGKSYPAHSQDQMAQ